METPTPTTPRSPAASSRTETALPLHHLSLLDHFQPPSIPQAAAASSSSSFPSSSNSSNNNKRDSTPTGYHRRYLSDFPPEIVALIAHHLYISLLPPPTLHPSPDPPLYLVAPASQYTSPTFLPTPAEQAREVFARIALVDRTWGAEGRKLLWRNVGFGMPRAFESILRTVEEYKTGQRQRRQARREANNEQQLQRAFTLTQSPTEEVRGRAMELDWISAGETNWCKMGGTNTALGLTGVPGSSDELANLRLAPVASALDPADSPLLYTKSLSFSRFRTAGLRRSVRQGSHERFVTPYRLLTLLRGTRIGTEVLLYPGSADDEEESLASVVSDDDDEDDSDEEEGRPVRGRLEAVGFTEFMDSAISKNVIDELLFRGGYLAEYEESLSLAPHGHHHSHPPDTAPLLSPPHHPGRLPLERRSSGSTFLARHLQSSHSRSPSSSSNTGQRLAPNPEESGESAAEEEEDGESSSGGRRFRRDGRRGSGSNFAPAIMLQSHDDDTEMMSMEDRGRERAGRSETIAGRGRGILRRNRSVIPPSAFTSRSMSVPAHHLQRSSSLGPSERSSSVPAAQRRGRGAKKIVQILEGSKEVRPIRALDLCGCVSSSFISSLAEAIATYKLGPTGLFASTTITAIAESAYSTDDDHEEEEEEDDDRLTESGRSIARTDTNSSRWSTTSSQVGQDDAARRRLRRIYFPHLRRLGLSSSLLPTPLLTSLVLSFPYLTHLDLSSTLTSPILLKQLALAGQQGPGGRAMRLAALSLAKCRLATGEAIVGLLCGDCPPFTSMAGMGNGEEAEDESWGSGEVVMDLIDLSLYGDATYPSPLSAPELRLILMVSPAFTCGRLRTIDLSSTPLTDIFLADHFPPQPHLIELGLSHCRGITIKGVAQLLLDKAPGVEVLTLSGSCPTTPTSSILSVMELHIALLGRVASMNASSSDPVQAQKDLQRRRTNLRVVELDEKTLEAVQGGAGDWKVIWGKGRRGWYIDTATTSISNPSAPSSATTHRLPRTLEHLPRSSPRRQALLRCIALNGVVSGEMGWHTRKMEIMRGDGMLGREEGLFAFHAYQV